MGRRGPKPKRKRNEEVRRRVAGGETLQAVADDFGISRQRVEQICNPQKHRARHAALEIEKAAIERIFAEKSVSVEEVFG